MLFYIAFILIAASLYLVISIAMQFKRKQRLHLFPEDESQAARIGRKIGHLPSQIVKPFEFIIRPISNLPYLHTLAMHFDTLKIGVDLSSMILIKLFLSVMFGLVTPFLFNPAYIPIGVLAGFFIPDFLIYRRIKRKREEIVRVLPETIDLLDMCISAGTDFLTALKWVIEKTQPNPFIEQLGIVLSEIQVGKPRSVALKDMSARLKLPDISSFVRTIVQAERMGTSIEDAFKNLSEDTRNRRFQEGERFAIRASIKILFPLLFCILPAIMIVVAGPIIIRFTQTDMVPKGMGF